MKKKLNKNKLIIIIILIICFFSLIFSIFKIVTWFVDNNTVKNELNIIEETLKEDISSTNEKNKSDSEIIDFNKLSIINNDVVGWIKVNGTNIDYPYVKTDDNNYYLTHSFKKRKTNSGWVFLDYRNDTEFTDKNNIIYGHARKDKSMFGTLKNILKSSWHKNSNNHTIRIITPNFKYLFQTFSIYHIKTESYYIKTVFKDDNDFKTFIETLLSRSMYDFKESVNEKDVILTLSSCYKTNEKVVLHAKLIKKEIRY